MCILLKAKQFYFNPDQCYGWMSEYPQKQTSQWCSEIACKLYHIPYLCALHFVECEKPAKKSMARDSLKSIEDFGYKFNEGIIYIVT